MTDRCNPARPLGGHTAVTRVAALLDVSPRFVKERINSGELKGYRLGGNLIVVDNASLQQFMESREIKLLQPAGR